MKHTGVAALIYLLGISGIAAEMGPVPQVSLNAGSSGSWNLAWNGRPGLTYFSKWSTDLVVWNYLPGIEQGSGLKTPSFTSTSPKFFVRIFYTNIPTNDAELADFDLDGVGNLAELNLGIDPMDPDSDHDGIPDGTEIANSSNPLSTVDGNTLRAGDSDGDGLSDAIERLRGTSPTLWDSDGDGFGDATDQYPLDPSRHTRLLVVGDTSRPTVTVESPVSAVLVSGP
jgi:Bacterial TSP3 repeat